MGGTNPRPEGSMLRNDISSTVALFEQLPVSMQGVIIDLIKSLLSDSR